MQFLAVVRSVLAEVPSFIDFAWFAQVVYQNLYGAVKIAGCKDPSCLVIFTLHKSEYGKLGVTGDRFPRPLKVQYLQSPILRPLPSVRSGQ